MTPEQESEVIKLIERIRASSSIEPKGSFHQAVKLGAEAGELLEEFLKKEGLTYKVYSPQGMLDELADIAMLPWAILFKLLQEGAEGISVTAFLETMNTKIDKWQRTVSTYHIFDKKEPDGN